MSRQARTVLITGGSRGIGLATGRALAARGDHVVLAARTAHELDARGLAGRTDAGSRG